MEPFQYYRFHVLLNAQRLNPYGLQNFGRPSLEQWRSHDVRAGRPEWPFGRDRIQSNVGLITKLAVTVVRADWQYVPVWLDQREKRQFGSIL